MRKDHPLRVVRAIADEILDSMWPLFDVMYAQCGGPPTAVGSTRQRPRSVCSPASTWAGEESHQFHNCRGKHRHGTGK